MLRTGVQFFTLRLGPAQQTFGAELSNPKKEHNTTKHQQQN